jgi:periplasmic divalent cation tolerance protein
MKFDLLCVSTATPDLATAKRLARSAVGDRLAGYAQVIGPVVSVYRELSETSECEEYQLLLSTTKAALPKLVEHLTENHPWENPNITAIPLVYATDVYGTWLHQTTIEG